MCKRRCVWKLNNVTLGTKQVEWWALQFRDRPLFYDPASDVSFVSGLCYKRSRVEWYLFCITVYLFCNDMSMNRVWQCFVQVGGQFWRVVPIMVFLYTIDGQGCFLLDISNSSSIITTYTWLSKKNHYCESNDYRAVTFFKLFQSYSALPQLPVPQFRPFSRNYSHILGIGKREIKSYKFVFFLSLLL